MLTLLFQHIKSTFVISFPNVVCISKANGVKTALTWLHNVMNAKTYRYVIRADIKSYYASIDLKILGQQVRDSFDDLRVLNYLHAIITAPIDDGGRLLTPATGIPRRSPLSPFLAALYLSPLDQAFENHPNVFYLRFMDDIVILAQTKSQFVAARKKLFRILRQLKLKLSDPKTRMGQLQGGFHFLGLQFQVQPAVSQNPWQNPSVGSDPYSIVPTRSGASTCYERRQCCTKNTSSRNHTLLAPMGKLVGAHFKSYYRGQSHPVLAIVRRSV